MNHITSTDLMEHLKWRYATKRFDPSRTIFMQFSVTTKSAYSSICVLILLVVGIIAQPLIRYLGVRFIQI